MKVEKIVQHISFYAMETYSEISIEVHFFLGRFWKELSKSGSEICKKIQLLFCKRIQGTPQVQINLVEEDVSEELLPSLADHPRQRGISRPGALCYFISMIQASLLSDRSGFREDTERGKALQAFARSLLNTDSQSIPKEEVRTLFSLFKEELEKNEDDFGDPAAVWEIIRNYLTIPDCVLQKRNKKVTASYYCNYGVSQIKDGQSTSDLLLETRHGEKISVSSKKCSSIAALVVTGRNFSDRDRRAVGVSADLKVPYDNLPGFAHYRIGSVLIYDSANEHYYAASPHYEGVGKITYWTVYDDDTVREEKSLEEVVSRDGYLFLYRKIV